MIQQTMLFHTHDAPLRLTRLARRLIGPVNRCIPNCIPLLAVFAAQYPRIEKKGHTATTYNRACRLACLRYDDCRLAFAAAIEANVENEDLELVSRGRALILTKWGPTGWRLQWFTGRQGQDYRTATAQILRAATKLVLHERKQKEIAQRPIASPEYLAHLASIANKRIDNA